ncbi:hypothetical protein BHM03_00058509, partial [Ensete ventricosum]
MRPRLWWQPLAKDGCAARGQAARSGCPHRVCKGRPPTASPATSSGDGASCNGGRPLVGRLPATRCRRRLCRGNGGGDNVEREEEDLGHSFYEKDYFAPLNLKVSRTVL